ncbi:SAM-dependent methyltransferase [Kineosporia sp. J2-2]|uniref:SAM-dependent methyltransferase n=1 Tax=Kineosporia corallincola TaxID=2835133 RepID=A0ABS5TA22_9ACTN|nr:class I SAM-dependent methyltransferase [Kineosporia corallincola]MBT0767897.1 SAM-dependent methyltransferase [Kineosporia corallincola]
MDLTGIATLLTSDGWALLESLPTYDESTAMTLGEQLRRDGHPSDLVAAALTQSRLRAAARAKFGPFAEGMLFTPTGLEQATRLPVAARHAQRFAAAGVQRVGDLGCGIGADSMALATLDREVVAVEKDEVTAAVATVNLRHWPEAVVRHEDAMTTRIDGLDGAFLDPARREASGRRLLDPRTGNPPLSFVRELAGRLPAVGMKTAPGVPHHMVPDDTEAQWVSVDGDVVECGLWFGTVRREGIRRSALVLDSSGGGAEINDSSMADTVPAEVGRVGQFLYEPDGAVIRAGLVAAVANQIGGRLVDPTIAYITSDRIEHTPLARVYAVDDVFGFQLKSLRTYLRDRGVGRLTIKKRGTAVEPEQLRKQLRLAGPHEATIVLTRVTGRQSVIVVRPYKQN